MADDATGRSKPPARRRRAPKKAPPEVAQDATLDAAGAPDPTEVAPVSDDGIVDVWPMSVGARDGGVICPFLQSVDGDGMLVDPVETPDERNRCAAIGDAVPQSLRQQQLVCLTSAHTSCPRYLRGATVETAAPVERTVTAPKLTPATIGALALLAAAFSASVMFMLARGGLDLPVAAGASPSPSESAVAVVPSPTPIASPSLAPSPTTSATPEPSATATPSPSPTPSPSASPTATPAPTPSPTSDRYALLKPCPEKPDCWIYRVRAGDNLFSIANYFGVPLATVRALNPWTNDGLRAGRDLILPPPTR